jgi:hypothetical protein
MQPYFESIVFTGLASESEKDVINNAANYMKRFIVNNVKFENVGNNSITKGIMIKVTYEKVNDCESK